MLDRVRDKESLRSAEGEGKGVGGGGGGGGKGVQTEKLAKSLERLREETRELKDTVKNLESELEMSEEVCVFFF